jgi:tetratricopeptide (TPR) repeat protein
MKKIILTCLTIFSISNSLGCSAGYPGLVKGNEYLASGEPKKAISEYEKELQAHKDGNPRLIMQLAINLGAAYQLLGDFEKASEYHHMSIRAWPERGYYGYLNLAILNYENGNIKEAYEYSLKAKELVNTPNYEKLEKGGYALDVAKNAVIGASDFYRIRVSVMELEREYENGNYDKAVELAENILNGKYHVYFGADLVRRKIAGLEKGAMADLNGFVKGDEILEVDGKSVADNFRDPYNALNKLFQRFGDVVVIKIERKGRVIPISCKLTYPEIERSKVVLQEAKARLAMASAKTLVNDTEAPQIKILEPKSARGIKIIARQEINFVILASDNISVKDVFINDLPVTSSEASALEKTYLPGEVKKYIAVLPLSQGKNLFVVKATDRSENIAQQNIEIDGDESAAIEIRKIYDHRVAVVIGINKYSPWPALEFAVNDAKTIKKKISKMGFDKIIEVYDGEATRERILRILADELPATMRNNDALFVFFAGHGATEELSDGGLEGYIIPVDGDTKDYRSSAISMSSIHEMIKRYKAKHILFAFDSCYSGLGLKRGGGEKIVGGFIKTMSEKSAVQIITAGGKDEQAAEKKGHGVFTKALLDSIESKLGLSKEGYLVASDVSQAVRKRVVEDTDGRQNPLFGWLAGEGDFIFEHFE